MKKTKIILVTVFIIILVISAIRIVTSVADTRDKKNLNNAYGHMVELSSGKRINICEYGDGDKTMVVLPGFGSVSPAYEYKGLSNKIHGYRILVVEPLGYGLSDMPDTDRTADNICEEIHETLKIEGVSEYTLMAHSISGLYSMRYIQKYPSEVDRFIGIDITVPNIDKEEAEGLATGIKVNNILKKYGIIRLLYKYAPDEEIALPGELQFLDSKEIDLLRRMSLVNTANKAMINEAEHLISNAEGISGFVFPSDMEVNLFVSSENCDSDGSWYGDHAALVKNGEDVSCEIITGTHYLHLSATDELALAISTLLR